MDVEIFVDMVQAKIRIDEEQFDMKMQTLAWQTSILINAMGKSKKRFKPKDLYKPMSDGDDKNVQGDFNVISESDKEKLQQELLNTFRDSL